MTKLEIQTLYEVMFTDYPDIVNVAQVQAMLGISRHCLKKFSSNSFFSAGVIAAYL